MHSSHDGSARQEWRQHWTVVMAAAAGVALSTIPAYSTGVMILPLEQEFDWTRAEISLGKTINGFMALLLAPLVGLAIDRWGPRRIAVGGTILFCLAIASLSQAGPSIWSWYLLWVGVGLGGLCVGPTVWTAAVSSLFAKGRGLALAFTLCGMGVGSSVTPLLSDYLIEHYGWRTAYVGLAAFWGAIAIPVILLRFTSAGDHHRRTSADKGVKADIRAALPGYTARQGFRRITFYKLAAAAVVTTLVVISFIINLVPILTFSGHSRTAAAAVASIVGLCSIVGRLSAGFLLDRLNANRVGAFAVALPLISTLMVISMPTSIAAAAVAAIMLGLCLGAELDAVAYLASRHFGVRSFGVLFGTIAGLLTFGAGVGPALTNHVYDVTGSYYPALWAFVPASLTASLLFLSLGRYPDFPEPETR